MAREEKSGKYGIEDAKGNECLKKEYKDEISFQQISSQILVKYTNSDFITEKRVKGLVVQQ